MTVPSGSKRPQAVTLETIWVDGVGEAGFGLEDDAFRVDQV